MSGNNYNVLLWLGSRNIFKSRLQWPFILKIQLHEQHAVILVARHLNSNLISWWEAISCCWWCFNIAAVREKSNAWKIWNVWMSNNFDFINYVVWKKIRMKRCCTFLHVCLLDFSSLLRPLWAPSCSYGLWLRQAMMIILRQYGSRCHPFPHPTTIMHN